MFPQGGNWLILIVNTAAALLQPDRGDRHSLHLAPRRLRELKKKLQFFIKGLDNSKNHAIRLQRVRLPLS